MRSFNFFGRKMEVCGGKTIGVLDFSPTFIIKPYRKKGGTEVPPYDIDKLQFVGLSPETGQLSFTFILHAHARNVVGCFISYS